MTNRKHTKLFSIRSQASGNELVEELKNAIQYQYAYDMFENLCNEYTYRYEREHLTDTKLRDILNCLPDNIKLGEWSEPPQCMPDDVKVPNDSISAYHKYYAVYKKDFAKWTGREVPQFMSYA